MTLIASYPNNNSAELAYNKLLETGMHKDHISIAALDSKTTNETHISDGATEVTSDTATGIATGAAIGFLIGAVALTIPGLGALLVTGQLAAALGSGIAAEAALGAAIGGVGGFVTGLVKSGANQKDAEMLQENLQNGGVILSVKDDESGSHKKLLELTNPTSLIVFAD
jgi:F0F1-type ATP synthase assembly protein I